MREILKQIKTRYFELQNLTVKFEKNQKQWVFFLWINHLKQLIKSIQKQKTKKTLKKLQKKNLKLNKTINLNDDNNY